MGIPLIPDKMPQDFDSRPYTKRIEWWNIFFTAVREAINYVWKYVSDSTDKIVLGGVTKNLLWKTLTGTSSGSGVDNVAHGITQDRILFYNVRIYIAPNGFSPFYYDGTNNFYYTDNATNIIITTAGAFITTFTYKITIAYYE
jgi:hypothetical protein